jgi:hypothetical protein
MHRAWRCSCCQIPHTFIFCFHQHNQFLCNSAIMSFFKSSLVAIMCIAFLFVPIMYYYSTPFFSLSLCRTQYYVHVFSPCHLAYLHLVFDCSFIVYSSIQPPTKCLSPHFLLCLCILTFLHFVVASFVLF